MFSEEGKKLQVDLTDVDTRKLNSEEQLGLVMLSEMSIGKLRELWGITEEQGQQLMDELESIVKKYRVQ